MDGEKVAKMDVRSVDSRAVRMADEMVDWKAFLKVWQKAALKAFP